MKANRRYILAFFLMIAPGIAHAVPFLESQLTVQFSPASIFGGTFWQGESNVSVYGDPEGEESRSVPASNPVSIQTEFGSAAFIPGQDPNPLGSTVRATIPIQVDSGSEWRSIASTTSIFFMVYSPGTTTLSFDYEEIIVASFDFPDNHIYTVRNSAYIDVFAEFPFDEEMAVNSERVLVDSELRDGAPSSFRRNIAAQIPLEIVVEPFEPLFVRMSMETWLEAVDISESPIHAPVPEPGTLILLASGGIGLIFLRKRR